MLGENPSYSDCKKFLNDLISKTKGSISVDDLPNFGYVQTNIDTGLPDCVKYNFQGDINFSTGEVCPVGFNDDGTVSKIKIVYTGEDGVPLDNHETVPIDFYINDYIMIDAPSIYREDDDVKLSGDQVEYKKRTWEEVRDELTEKMKKYGMEGYRVCDSKNKSLKKCFSYADITQKSQQESMAVYTLTEEARNNANTYAKATNFLLGESFNGITHFKNPEIFATYQNYLTDYYGSTVTCDGDDSQASANGLKKIKYYVDEKVKTCYASSPTKNSDKSVNGFKEGFFGIKNCDFDCVTNWLKSSKVKASQLKKFDITSGTGKAKDNSGSNDSDDEGGVCYANAGKLGWILCPIIESISNVGKWLWGEIETNFLQIRVGDLFQKEDSVQKVWGTFRDIANIIFIIFFLVVIFSQLTGVGIDNYGVKKILPKLIVVAILINLSYLLCLLAVDVSNILGVGLKDLFASLAPEVQIEGATAGQYLAAAGLGVGVGGGILLFSILANPLSGIAVGATIAITVLGVVITIVVSILFMFLILMVRYAGIIILIAIAPVAIVCYLLPNTEKIFKRWLDLLKVLLLVYPICGALIGAGTLAGNLLASTGNETMTVVGMIVEVVPFFLIPMLLKQSLSLMGNIGAKLSGVGKTVGKGLSSKTQGAIRNSDKFKNWSQYQQDKAGMRRASRIQRRLQGIKDSGGVLSERNKEKLLQATEKMDTYERRRILADEGKMPLDGDTLRQNIRAEKSNTLEKMYTDNYMRMTDRGQVDSAFQAALAGDSGENAAAAMKALIQKGGTTEVLNALNGADWSNMNVGVKSYLAQAMGASNVDALKGYSKYLMSNGGASFQEWSNGSISAAQRAADATNGVKADAASYAQYLKSNGPDAMSTYTKDEMQYIQANAAGLRSELGNEEYGRMLGNAMVNSKDAKAQTIAEQIVTSALANTDPNRMKMEDLDLTAEKAGKMRGQAAQAILDGETMYVQGRNPAMNPANYAPGSAQAQQAAQQSAAHATRRIQHAFSPVAQTARNDNRIRSRMDRKVGQIIGV